MSYYDFEYFWTHQEVGGQKLEREKQEIEQQLTPVQKILKFILGEENCIEQQPQLNTDSIQRDSEL